APAAGPIAVAAAQRLGCHADIARIVFGPAGEVLNLGRTTRQISAAQRRALVLRDRGCVWPGCTRPPVWTEAHHLIWWRHSGTTDLDNLALLCAHHHHRIHEHGWTLTHDHDGGWTATSPDH